MVLAHLGSRSVNRMSLWRPLRGSAARPWCAGLGLAVLASCGGNPSIDVRVSPLSSSDLAGGGAPSLVVSPTADACDREGLEVVVAWRLDASARVPVTVRVGDADGTVFAETSASVGQAMTGPWATAGLEFFLVDAGGDIIASTAVSVPSC